MNALADSILLAVYLDGEKNETYHPPLFFLLSCGRIHSMSGTTFNSMRNKAPKPLWPWFAGAAAVVGGYTWMRNKNMNILHRPSSSVLPHKTQVKVTDKK